MKHAILLFALVLAGLGAQAQNWTIDKSHTDIRFTTTHMTIAEVDGRFKTFEGKITSKGADFNGAAVEFTAQVASITTDNERRDNHLKGPDFFDAEKFPEVKFKGNLQKKGKGYLLVGDFTMKDVTKPIKFNVTYLGKVATQRGAKAGFKITGVINRFDYGLKWSNKMDTGGLVVGENIQITCNVEMNEVK